MSSQVFQEASAQVQAWQVGFEWDPPLKVSMNFTSTQFTESEVESTIIAAFKSSGLEGSQVIAEITESVMIRNIDSVRTVLEGLKLFGIEVHVDDFGTGYSSLSYLHRLPVDALKVDRSFVGRLPEDEEADILVRTIVDLAHHLGMHVVAEGIETPAQLDAPSGAGLRARPGILHGEARRRGDRRVGPLAGLHLVAGPPRRQGAPSAFPRRSESARATAWRAVPASNSCWSLRWSSSTRGT